MLFFIVLAPGVIFYEYLSFTRLGFPLVIKTEDKVFHTWDVGPLFLLDSEEISNKPSYVIYFKYNWSSK